MCQIFIDEICNEGEVDTKDKISLYNRYKIKMLFRIVIWTTVSKEILLFDLIVYGAN